jgi:hypothetical protein
MYMIYVDPFNDHEREERIQGEQEMAIIERNQE